MRRAVGRKWEQEWLREWIFRAAGSPEVKILIFQNKNYGGKFRILVTFDILARFGFANYAYELNFGLEHLGWYVLYSFVDLFWYVWFCILGLVGLVLKIQLSMFGFAYFVRYVWSI